MHALMSIAMPPFVAVMLWSAGYSVSRGGVSSMQEPSAPDWIPRELVACDGAPSRVLPSGGGRVHASGYVSPVLAISSPSPCQRASRCGSHSVETCPRGEVSTVNGRSPCEPSRSRPDAQRRTRYPELLRPISQLDDVAVTWPCSPPWPPGNVGKLQSIGGRRALSTRVVPGDRVIGLGAT